MATLSPFPVFSHWYSLIPTSAADLHYVSKKRVPYAIFVATADLLVSIYCKNDGNLLVSSGQEVAAMVRDNVRQLVTHCDLHPDSLHILSLIKCALEYLLGACWLCVIANLLPSSIHFLLMVAIAKPSVRQNGWFKIHHYPADVPMNRVTKCFKNSHSPLPVDLG